MYLVFVSFILITASISFFKEKIDINTVESLEFKSKGIESLKKSSEDFTEKYYDSKVKTKEKILQDEINEVFSIMNKGSSIIDTNEKMEWLLSQIKNREMSYDKFVWITSSSGNFLASVNHPEDYHIVNVSEKLISTFNDTKYIDNILGARQNMFWIEMYNPIHERYTKNLVLAYYDRNYDIIVYVAALSEDFSKMRSDIENVVKNNMAREMTNLSNNGIIGFYDNKTFKAEYYGGGYVENIYEDSDIQEDLSILQMIKSHENQAFKYVIRKNKEYISRTIYVNYDEKNDIYYFASNDINKKYIMTNKFQSIVNMITISAVLICSFIGFKTWEWMSNHYFKKQRRIKKHLNLDDK